MKKTLLLSSFIFCIARAFAQPVLYVNFVSHNEETTTWNNTPFYTGNRSQLISLAGYFQANGITWNLQSDWIYLTNVLTQETPTLIASTNNKNILRYLHEDKGVEIDPHAHETQYIYPDVVKLMDSVGLPESKIMGGTLYNTTNGINCWMSMINGQSGVIFPSRTWQPQWIWGAGTPNHTNDPKYFGVWNPQDTSNFLTHNPAQPLRYLATGCDIKIKDTSNVSYIMLAFRDVLNNIQNGNYPASGFYMQTIFFEQGDLNNAAFYNKVIQVADSINAIVAGGQAQWKTLKGMYTEWQTTYSSQMFQWGCGQLNTGMEEHEYQGASLYPNPATDEIKFELGTVPTENAGLKVYNGLGQLVHQAALTSAVYTISLRNMPAGIYFVEAVDGDQLYRSRFLKK